MNKLKEHPIITMLFIEALIVLILAICGFRITYDPDLINDWTAIEAVGTWIGGLIISFAVIWVQKHIEDSERRTGVSNAATIERVYDILNNPNHNNGKEKAITNERVYSIIKIHIVITSENIARELGVDVCEIEENLRELYSAKRITIINGFGNIKKGVKDCTWKVV